MQIPLQRQALGGQQIYMQQRPLIFLHDFVFYVRKLSFYIPVLMAL